MPDSDDDDVEIESAEFMSTPEITEFLEEAEEEKEQLQGRSGKHWKPMVFEEIFEPVFGPEKRRCETNTPPPAKKARQIRRPCGFCPKKPDASRLSTFCYICSIPVCKDHRHYICDSCSEKN